MKNAPTSIVSFTLLRARKNVEFQQINKVIRIRGKVPGSSWFGASRRYQYRHFAIPLIIPGKRMFSNIIEAAAAHTLMLLVNSKMNRNYPSLNLPSLDRA